MLRATILGFAIATASADKPTASELRRYEGSADCTGTYSLLSTDVMDECAAFSIPAPASIKIEYVNETAYASYHYQGVKDCSGDARKLLAYWTVGACESFQEGNDVSSQIRAWVRKSAPSDGAVIAGTANAGTAGACTGQADHTVWEGVKGNISSIQKTCIDEGAPGAQWYDHCIKKFIQESVPGDDPKGGEKCMTNCVAVRAKLSTTCSACFGAMAECTFKNCAMKCLDAKAPACVQCCNQNCIPQFGTCSGLDDLPPPSSTSSMIV